MLNRDVISGYLGNLTLVPFPLAIMLIGIELISDSCRETSTDDEPWKKLLPGNESLNSILMNCQHLHVDSIDILAKRRSLRLNSKLDKKSGKHK